MASFWLSTRNKEKKSSASINVPLETFSINDLPLEIFLEILYKLPVKQLHANKIVSKLWLSLISHPSFPYQFLFRINSTPAISPSFTIYLIFPGQFSNSFNGEHLTYNGDSISCSKNNPFDFLPDVFPGRKLRYNVLASSNGLLLCSKTYYHFPDLYYVCNPTTKQWFFLPPPPTRSLFTFWGIVCNPNSQSENGLTCFKVVKIASHDDQAISKILNMEIFESATNQWRVLTKNFHGRTFFHTTRFDAVEHKGIVYCNDRNGSVVAFDSNLGICPRISLPIVPRYHSVFAVCQNHLYFVQVDRTSTRIWRCHEFEGKYTWNSHGIFDMDWIYQQNIFSENWRHRKILAMDPMNCNILYLSSSDQISCIRRIYSLDLGRREMRKLCSFPLGLGNIGCNDYDMRYLMFVQSSWPTAVPRMPPETDPLLGGQDAFEHAVVGRKRRKPT